MAASAETPRTRLDGLLPVELAVRHLEARMQARADGHKFGWSVYDVTATRSLLRELQRLTVLHRQECLRRGLPVS